MSWNAVINRRWIGVANKTRRNNLHQALGRPGATGLSSKEDPVELVKLTAKEFKNITALVYDQTGIHLPESKLTLLSNRLRRRLRSLKLETFQEYYDLLRDPKKCQDELPDFLSAVTTNETYFFRNDNLWKFFRETWIPQMVKERKQSAKKSLRIWSAASSSGEEAYTAAICLREHLTNFASWNVAVVGSDISDRVLEQARAAEYNDYAVAKISKSQMTKWFTANEQTYQLKPEIRKIVSFQFHNLRDRFPGGAFDLIFLRNVLMYFDTPMKQKVLDTVTEALVPGGYLFVGDVDPLRNTPELNETLKVDYIGPNLYRKPDASKASKAKLQGSLTS